MKNSTNNNYYLVAAVAIIIFGGILAIQGKIEKPRTLSKNEQKKESVQSNTANKTSSSAAEAINQYETKIFEISGKNFSYDIQEIKVRKGERAKILFINTDGKHNINIDEFNASTATIVAGETAEMEFMADQSGVFEYYCSIESHRQMGMIGKLIVEE